VPHPIEQNHAEIPLIKKKPELSSYFIALVIIAAWTTGYHRGSPWLVLVATMVGLPGLPPKKKVEWCRRNLVPLYGCEWWDFIPWDFIH